MFVMGKIVMLGLDFSSLWDSSMVAQFDIEIFSFDKIYFHSLKIFSFDKWHIFIRKKYFHSIHNFIR